MLARHVSGIRDNRALARQHRVDQGLALPGALPLLGAALSKRGILPGRKALVHRALQYRPAHVHVTGTGGEAVFILDCPGGPPSLLESYGFSRQAVGRILDDLAAHLVELCKHWSEIHGRY